MSVALPKVSVVMPVYNGAEYVSQAVESILAQTFADFEFVIVNDGSTDGSTQILREYARRDRRIVLVEQDNQGCTQALNQGLARARAEFVARMDSDDVSLPERLALQVAFLQAHPEVVVVGGQAVEIDSDGDCVRPLRKALSHDEIERRLLGHSKMAQGGLIHPSVMMRREAVERVGGYSASLEAAQDRDLWLRLAEVGKLANLPETIISYRVHTESVSQGRSATQHKCSQRAIKEAHRRRGLELPAQIEMWSLDGRQRAAYEIAEGRALSAARNGYYRTARKHAVRVLCRRPWRGRAWKAVVVTAIGRRNDGRREDISTEGAADATRELLNPSLPTRVRRALLNPSGIPAAILHRIAPRRSSKKRTGSNVS